MKGGETNMNEMIRQLRLSRGMTQRQLADALGIKSYTTITKWEKGENVPQGRDLIKLSKLFNVSVDDILGINIIDNNINQFPYFPTAISAGLPLTVDGVTETSTISVSSDVLGKYSNDRDIFFARINGNSMDKIMSDGTLIAIKPLPITSLNNGDIVVFSTDHEYSVKHYYRYGDALVFKPNSHDLRHKEQEYSINGNITIHGKVITYIINLD